MYNYNRIHSAPQLDAFAGNGALTSALEELIILITKFFRGFAKLGRRVVIAQRRAKAYSELAVLDDRILADIGLQRSTLRETVEDMIR